MKYLLSIVLLALIGFTTPKKTIPAKYTETNQPIPKKENL